MSTFKFKTKMCSPDEFDPKRVKKEESENPFALHAWKIAMPKRLLSFALCRDCMDRVYRDFKKVQFLSCGEAKIMFVMCSECVQHAINSTDQHRILIAQKVFDGQNEEAVYNESTLDTLEKV
jgi:hypothetical protein